MSQWNLKRGYNIKHFDAPVYTLANESSLIYPTKNTSTPLPNSTIYSLLTRKVFPNLEAEEAHLIFAEKVEIIHDGNVDVRFNLDGWANESTGQVLKPGEKYEDTVQVNNYLSVYTSSNVSQALRITLNGFA